VLWLSQLGKETKAKFTGKLNKEPKNNKQTTGRYELRCDGKKWITGGQTISCTYNYYGASAVVEGEKSPPHEYFRNEVKNTELVISTFSDSQRKQIISMSVFDPSN